MILGLLDTALGARDAYDHDQVPSPRPAEYVAISLSRRFGGERRMSAHAASAGYRLTVRAVSQQSIANVRNSLEKCRASLEFRRLSVAGATSTPVQFENEQPPIPDDGWFSGAQSFTFVL